jgi:hypothetical protein
VLATFFQHQVYDRVRENLTRFKKMPLAELIDLSINETLTRTIGTSVALFLAIVPLALFGGPALREFAVVLLFGLVLATSSSIFIAAPILLNLGEKRLTGRRIAEVVRSYLHGTAGRRKQPSRRHSSRRAASNTPTDAESANRSVNGRGLRAEVQQMWEVLGYLSRLPASPALSRLFRHSTSDWRTKPRGFPSSSCRDHLGFMVLAEAPPAPPARLGNEPPTTFPYCRCASSPGAMPLHLRRSKRVIAIHRSARSKQRWARTRNRTFQNTLRGHEARRIQGCTAPGNPGRIRQDRAAGKAHTRPRGNIGLIAVWARDSSIAGGPVTPPSTGPSGHTA